MAIPPRDVSAERALDTWPPAEQQDDPDAPRADAPTPNEAKPDGDEGVKPISAASLRIRQIELAGFKSFRDRVVLRFPTGVTAIVGPNGCGKSNVVDAIRWVLGEQSAKRLRGQEMEDVIFAGGERGGAVGLAQVSIVFETDGLPMEQYALLKETGHPLGTAGPSEIMVTRRYLRSGESEYQMNGVPCRLRDITELFLGTGLGGRAYAIIEQGRVERLVGAKPEELRLFIEEAAGTTLYRSRRQVAERKMERTRENLARVLDILREVERQLASLRRQAKRAEQFKTLQAEAATLDLSLSARERAHMARELEALRERRAALQARQAALTGALEGMERERQAARDQESAALARIQRLQTAAFEAQSANEGCRYEIARLEGRIAELGAQASTIADELGSAQAQQSSAGAECATAEQDLGALMASIETAEGDLAAREAEGSRLAEAQVAVGGDLEAKKGDLVRALTAEVDLRNQRTTAEKRREEEAARGARLREARDGAVAREQAALTRANDAERTVVETQGRLERLEGVKRSRSDELRSALAERVSWDASLDGVKDGVARARSRRDSLREIEVSHATYGEGVRAVLAASSTDEALGLVAEILEIPEELERAVAAVLGDVLQGVVMRDQTAASEAVQALRRAAAGRATCLPQAARVPARATPAPGKPLLDLIGVRAGYEGVAKALLGRILLVDDLTAALAAWQTTAGRDADWTLVTRSGERVDPSGAITGGTEPSEEVLLTQRRELRVLDGEVVERERNLEAAVRRQEELAGAVEARQTALAEVDAELGQLAVAAVGAEKDVQRARHEMQEAQAQREETERDLTDAGADLEARDRELQQLGADLESAERERAGLESAVDALERRLVEVREAITRVQREATDVRVGLAEQRTRRDALGAAIERLRRTGDEASRRVTALADRQRADASALEESKRALAEAQARADGLAREATQAAEAVEAAQRATADARTGLEQAERRATEVQGHLDGVRTEGGTLDVQLAEQRLAVSHLEETIRTQYQRELADVEVDETGDPEAQQERLAYLRKRIAAMGEVNVAALGEVADLEERQRFLQTQQGDLEQALEDLRRTIARLNRTSRTKFRETFARVDATFREVFPKLFDGGRAQLRLTDETQVLESGVEIMVQLPGKRVASLALLSGGEKALTAVSLIFALFLINPSPFCFLDEVDAPLDDANIGRFNAMVREMSAHSQFILITHNKRTMEVAETLYGVTMQEPGVSEVVSVRLPD